MPLCSFRTKRSLKTHGIIPGAVLTPRIVCVFPEHVCPYAIIDILVLFEHESRKVGRISLLYICYEVIFSDITL